MTLRAAVLIICGLVTLIGGALLQRSFATPQWTDERRANEIMTRDPEAAISGSKDEYAAFNARWRRDINALRTDKWPLFDLGSGLIVLAASGVAALYLLRIRTNEDLIALRTPSKRGTTFLLFAALWAAVYALFYHSILDGFFRFEYPPWADSIIIPQFEIAVLMIITFPFLAALVWFVALRKAKLPVNVWTWRPERPVKNWASTVMAGLALAAAVLVIVDALRFGPYSAIPAMFLAIYITLSLRAASISG